MRSRRSQRLMTGTCLAALVCVSATGLARAQERPKPAAAAPLWGAHADIVGRTAREHSAAGVEFFVPLLQNQDSMIFIDAGINGDFDSEVYGTFGLGYRRIVTPELILGGIVAVDVTRTDEENTFGAISFGAEAIGTAAEARINVQLPFTGARLLSDETVAISQPGTLTLLDNRLVERTANRRITIDEVPLTGVEGEIGINLPIGFDRLDDQLKAFAGAYHYGGDGVDSFTGVSGRLEYSVRDVMGDSLPGAALILSAGLTHDAEHGTNFAGEARLRIPLGVPARPDANERVLSPIEERMTQRVVRTTRIHTSERTRTQIDQATRIVTDPLTGRPLDAIYFADGADTLGAGSAGDPTTLADAVQRAGVGGLIVAEGGNGTIDTPGVVLADSQRLLGGGVVIPVQLADGTVASFQLGRTAPVIVGIPAANVVTLAANNRLQSLTITGGLNAIAGTNVGALALQQITIAGSAAAGVSIANNAGTSTLAVDGLSVSGVGGAGIAVNGLAGGSTTVTGFAGVGVASAGGGGVLFDGVTFDADPLTAGFQRVEAGNLTIGDQANPAAIVGDGLRLNQVAGDLNFASLLIANSNGAGLFIRDRGGPGGDFSFGNSAGAITTVGGAAIDIDPVSLAARFGSVSSTNAQGQGSGGAHGVFLDHILARDAGSPALVIGSLSITGAAGHGLVATNNPGDLVFGTTTIANVGGTGIVLANNAGAVTFADTVISNPRAGGIDIAGTNGRVGFGHVDITGLGAGKGLDLTDASGYASTRVALAFQTLDIAGTGAAGSVGIDYSGTTNIFDVTTADSSTISGVGIGIDLRNAAATGLFQFGDGSATDADGRASRIDAVRPLEIAGLNGTTGLYNLRDVAFVGDISNLSGVTVFYVDADGGNNPGIVDGTAADPGTLAQAIASGADVIALVDNQIGGQDVIDAGAAIQGGPGSLTLASGQRLISFLTEDRVDTGGGGGVPNNLLLTGIDANIVRNPNAGSGAPRLTTTEGGRNTLVLGNNNMLAGVVIDNGAGAAAVFGSGISGLTVRNSQLTAVALTSAGGLGRLENVAMGQLTLDGGTIALTGVNADIAHAGPGNALSVGGGHGGSIGFDAASSITATGGTGVRFNAASGSYSFGGPTTLGGGANLAVSGLTGSLSFGNVAITNPSGNGIDLAGTIGAISFGDLGIGGVAANAVALDFNGANLAGAFTARSLVATSAGGTPPAGSIGIDLRGVTGGQAIRVGVSPAPNPATDTPSSLGNFVTGVFVDAASNAAFTFGDGEDTVDRASRISATTPINAASAPVLGSYNFLDVDFAGTAPGAGFSPATVYYFSATGTGTGATQFDPGSISSAEASGADLLVPIGGATINAANSNGNGSLDLIAAQQLRGFETAGGTLALGFTGPPTIQISALSATIGNLTGNPSPALTTSAAGENVVNLSSGNQLSFISTTGGASGIAGSGINNLTATNVSVANTTGAGIALTGTSSAIAFAGTTRVTASGGTGVSVAATGGTVSFATLSVDNAATAGGGVSIGGPASYGFTNGLAIRTSSGTGFAASGGATIGVAAAGTRQVTTATGPIIAWNDVAIGAGGASFNSLTATGIVTGDAIDLRSVAGSGSFSAGTVAIAGTTGLGADGIQIVNSGARFDFGAVTIADVAARGIALTGGNGDITFASIDITGGAGRGVEIFGATNDVTFNGGSIGPAVTAGFPYRFVVFNQATASTISLSNVDITGDAGSADLFNVQNSAGTITVTGGTFSQASSLDTVGISGGSATITIGADLVHTGTGNATAINGTAGTIRFDGTVSNAGGGRAFDVGAIGGGTVTFNGAITDTGSSGVRVRNLAAGAAVSVNAALSVTDAAADALSLTDNAGMVTFAGTTTLTNPGAAGVAVTGSNGAIGFTSLQIALQSDNTTGVDLGGASLDAGFAATGFGLTSTSPTGTTAINLSGTTSTGTVRFGDTDAAGQSATIGGAGANAAGPTTGIQLAGANIANFIFGDGESAADQGSRIVATNRLDASAGPLGGSYNILDVDFAGAAPGPGFTPATAYYFSATGTGTGATIDDPGSIAGAQASNAALLVPVGAATIDAAGAGGSLDLIANQQLRGFDAPGGTLDIGFAYGGAGVIQTTATAGNISDSVGAGSPLLTTTSAAPVVNLSDGNTLSRIRIDGGAIGVSGTGTNGLVANNLTVANASGAGISLAGAAGSIAFGGTTTVTATGGVGVSALGTVGTISFETLSVDNTLTAGGGVALNGTGSFNFTDGLVIRTSSGAGFTASGGGTISVAAVGTRQIATSTGRILDLNGVGIGGANISFASLTAGIVDNADAINLTGVSGGTFAGGATTIAGTTGAGSDGIEINGSAANIGFGTTTIGVAGGGTGGNGILISNAGPVTFTGTTTIANPAVAGASGVRIAGANGAISFADLQVDLGTANTTGLDLSGTTVTSPITAGDFDVNGGGFAGTLGIDLVGATGAGAIQLGDTVNNNPAGPNSTIANVGTGVLVSSATNLGSFVFGDGAAPAESSIATIGGTGLAIAATDTLPLLGSYNFLDADLSGSDVSNLASSITYYYVDAVGAGTGTATSRGNVAGAIASGAQVIVLVDNTPGIGAETIDIASAAQGTGSTLSLATGQALISFRDSNTVDLATLGFTAGGAPASFQLTGVPAGGTIVTDPTGNGAPILTTAAAVPTVTLTGSNGISGVVIANGGGGAGISGTNIGDLILLNSTIRGGPASPGVAIASNTTTSLALSNLTLRSGTGAPALSIDGTGGATTITRFEGLTVEGGAGAGAGIAVTAATFDSDTTTPGFQSVAGGNTAIGAAATRVNGNGLAFANVLGVLDYGTLDIANDGGTGLLVQNPKTNAFTLNNTGGGVDTTNGTAINLDPLTIGMSFATVNATGGTNGIIFDQVAGTFNVTGATSISNTTGFGITAINTNTGTFSFNTVTVNNAASAGGGINVASGTLEVNGLADIDTTTGTGASISGGALHFLGGVTIDTTSGTGLAGTGGTLRVANNGTETITTTTGSAVDLSAVTLGAGGVNFDSITVNGAANGILLTNVTSAGGGPLALGTVNLQNVTARGLDISGTVGAAMSFADLDISLHNSAAIAFDLNSATVGAAVTANDFDVTNNAAAGTSIAVDLRGATGGSVVRLGDAVAGGASSSIAGVNTGVFLDAATNLAFTYGDGELDTDQSSTISAAVGIDASAAPVAGTYNFRDVLFPASPGSGFGLGRIYFVAATATGDGTGRDAANRATLSAAELASSASNVIVLINNGSPITAANTNGNDTLVLSDGEQVRGFRGGAINLALAVPTTIQLATNSISIADPTLGGAATLTTSAGADVITLGGQDNIIDGFILDGNLASALRGINDNGGGATNTLVNNMTISNFGTVGIEITPSTNTTITNTIFTGNVSDVLLNAAGTTISDVTSTGATGTAFRLNDVTGTTTLTNLSITGAAAGGLAFNGTHAGTINLTNVDISAANALSITGGAGTFTFDATSSIANTGGTAVSIANRTGGAITFGGTVVANGATNGISVSGATGANTVSFTGTVDLGVGTALTGTAVSLANANTTTSFANIDIVTSGTTGFTASGGGTVNVTTGTLGSTSAQALNLNGVAAGMTFTSTTSSGGTNNAALTSVTGTVNLGAGAFAGASGASVLMSGGSANVAYGGSVSRTAAGRLFDIQTRTGGNVTFSGTLSATGAATGIFASGNTGGTITFSGATKTFNTGANGAVNLTNNAGAAIDFTNGGLAITTTSAVGFNATGPGPGPATGGTVTVQGTGNTIAAGIGLNVANTTIGAAGLTFQRISAVNGTNGIVLDNTGALGGLTVTGTGAANSGGTISGMTGGDILSGTNAGGQTTSGTGGTGIFLRNTRNVSLTSMNMSNFSNFAIYGNNVTNFSLAGTTIGGFSGLTNAGDREEGAIRFDNLFGNATISASNISGGFTENVAVYNTSGTLNRLTMNGSNVFGFVNGVGGDDNVTVTAYGTAIANVTLDANTFAGTRGDFFETIANGNSVMDVVVTNNIFLNGQTPIPGGGTPVSIRGDSTGTAATVTYTVSNNNLSAGGANAFDAVGIFVAKGNGAGTFSGSIANNQITGRPGSNAAGIFVRAAGSGTSTVLIENNEVSNYGTGIRLQNNDGSSTMNASIFANSLSLPNAGGFSGLFVDNGATAGDTSRMNVVIGSTSNAFLQNTLAGGGFVIDVSLANFSAATTFNLSRAGSAAGTAEGVVRDGNVGLPSVDTTGGAGPINLVPTSPPLP